MELINIVVLLVVVGAALYLVNAYVPMAAPVKTVLNVVVVLVLLLWLLGIFGIGSIVVGPPRGRMR